MVGDAKTGNFKNDIYEKKKQTPSALTAEDKALLLTKNKSLPVKLTLKDWHTLVIRTKADEIEVSLGALDSPDQLMPTYELWTTRRESWLPPFPLARRYERDRDPAGRFED